MSINLTANFFAWFALISATLLSSITFAIWVDWINKSIRKARMALSPTDEELDALFDELEEILPESAGFSLIKQNGAVILAHDYSDAELHNPSKQVLRFVLDCLEECNKEAEELKAKLQQTAL